MRRFVWPLELTLIGLGLAGSVSAGQAQSPTTEPVVQCQVMGHDVILYNRGEAALPVGTTIHWSAWNGRREGEHTLETELVPDVGLQLSSALGASYLWDRPCEAAVLTADVSP